MTHYLFASEDPTAPKEGVPCAVREVIGGALAFRTADDAHVATRQGSRFSTPEAECWASHVYAGPVTIIAREIVWARNVEKLRQEGCICGDYAAVTGMLHPDCPIHSNAPKVARVGDEFTEEEREHIASGGIVTSFPSIEPASRDPLDGMTATLKERSGIDGVKVVGFVSEHGTFGEVLDQIADGTLVPIAVKRDDTPQEGVTIQEMDIRLEQPTPSADELSRSMREMVFTTYGYERGSDMGFGPDGPKSTPDWADDEGMAPFVEFAKKKGGDVSTEEAVLAFYKGLSSADREEAIDFLIESTRRSLGSEPPPKPVWLKNPLKDFRFKPTSDGGFTVVSEDPPKQYAGVDFASGPDRTVEFKGYVPTDEDRENLSEKGFFFAPFVPAVVDPFIPDDPLPHPDWPVGHAEKLLATFSATGAREDEPCETTAKEITKLLRRIIQLEGELSETKALVPGAMLRASIRSCAVRAGEAMPDQDGAADRVFRYVDRVEAAVFAKAPRTTDGETTEF